MQLKERDGIACDYCGMKYRNDFIYYSFDFHHVYVNENIRPPINHILRSPVMLSLDVCTSCFDTFRTKIVNNYKNQMSPKRGGGKSLVCDWTGEILVGTFEYYYCNVTKASVRMNGQPNICVNCGFKTLDDQQACSKCNGTSFSKFAAIETNDRFLELIISNTAHNHFVDKLQEIRKVASEWSTES